MQLYWISPILIFFSFVFLAFGMSTMQKIFQGQYEDWSCQQKADLHELQSSINPSSPDDETLRRLITKNLSRYHDYTVSRAQMAKVDAPALFAPKWNSTFENAYLWIAGCRPAQYFRLVYAISGHEVETRLNEYLEGSTIEGLGKLTCEQLNLVSELQGRTVDEEDKLTDRLTKLQEDLADQPLALLASERLDSSVGDIDALVNRYASSLGEIVEEADRLRFNTLREMVEQILTPRQAVEFLIAAKKLHFRVHEWGLRRDQQHGIETEMHA